MADAGQYTKEMPVPTIAVVADPIDVQYDALVVVCDTLDNAYSKVMSQLTSDATEQLQAAAAVDKSIGKEVAMVVAPAVPGCRLIIAPTGNLDRHIDDVRRVADAAMKGMQKATTCGAIRPVFAFAIAPKDQGAYEMATEAGVLGALDAIYKPIMAREHGINHSVEAIGVLGACDVELVTHIERGRVLARDVGGTDPERMAPKKCAEELVKAFAGTRVSVEVVDVDVKEYPLAHAVGRCSFAVDRHVPQIVRLEYKPDGPAKKHLLFAGKGIVYDTGGADIKVGGAMIGMSRDKCGAAVVAGFFKALAARGPSKEKFGEGTYAYAELMFVRNSVGSDAYVADEIITSHAGVRCKIGNTDAEGRMVLADALSHLRVKAAALPADAKVELFSVATLTGHAVRAVGKYSIALPNGVAEKLGTAPALVAAGDTIGDPFEISRQRRDDFDFIAPKDCDCDVVQANNLPSTMTSRGHQFPAAFLAIASGLWHTEEGSTVAYTHLDVAGSATGEHDKSTGRPVAALVKALL